MGGEYHPAFTKADPRHRWTSRLTHLRPLLEGQAGEISPKFAWRILPHGACVALQVTDEKITVRISREEAPPEGSLEKWMQEVAIFRRELRLEGWEQKDVADAIGIAVTFTCPVALLCEGCGRKKSETGMLFGDPDLCDHCQIAKKSGREP